ncbi:MAG: hypothetical protein ACRDF4_04980 [Rhabdochlamydiaceae bacterium]
MITKRLLLTTSAFLPFALLIGCAGKTATQVTETVVSDAAVVSNAVATIFSDLSNTLPADIVASARSLALSVAKAASDLKTTLTLNAAQPVVNQFEAAASTFLLDLAPFTKSNSNLSAIVSDINIILPVIVAAVQLVAAAPSNQLEVNHARQYLHTLPKEVVR